jgi:hypothetical protein
MINYIFFAIIFLTITGVIAWYKEKKIEIVINTITYTLFVFALSTAIYYGLSKWGYMTFDFYTNIFLVSCGITSIWNIGNILEKKDFSFLELVIILTLPLPFYFFYGLNLSIIIAIGFYLPVFTKYLLILVMFLALKVKSK